MGAVRAGPCLTTTAAVICLIYTPPAFSQVDDPVSDVIGQRSQA